MTPVREQQLASLLSQIELMRQDYAGLQRKQQEAELARDLEKNQRGQQYRLIDAPSFPTGPSSPKRLPLTAAAVAGSLGLGLALAFVLELKNRSFHTETELRKQFPASLVLAVPLIFTPAEERARRWKHFGEWCAGSALVLAVLAVQWFALQQS
jgi:hypothetical protein